MAITISCDREGCPSRQDLGASEVWLVVHGMDDDETTPGSRHYCTRECAAMDLAGFEIPEGVPSE